MQQNITLFLVSTARALPKQATVNPRQKYRTASTGGAATQPTIRADGAPIGQPGVPAWSGEDLPRAATSGSAPRQQRQSGCSDRSSTYSHVHSASTQDR